MSYDSLIQKKNLSVNYFQHFRSILQTNIESANKKSWYFLFNFRIDIKNNFLH